uniref:Uncharacterized protein n=1 Tax=Tanacetum cinerariifolium TaxID=118510 RepID=A0A6L2NB91_TANCI|nr:hypothetical protein [Tanacetum cinerariifolium]
MSETMSPIPPPPVTNTGNTGSPNRVDTFLNDNTNNTGTNNVTPNSSTSKALISYSCIRDSDSDVKEDTRSISEFLVDLNVEFHDRALLANQKRFYKRGKCKSLKYELAVITKKIDAISKNKSEKGLVAESFDWDEKSLSSEDKGVTRVKAFMAITEDEPAIEKDDAKWEMKKEGNNFLKGSCVHQGSESPFKTIHKITSDSESKCENQEPLPLFPKLLRAEPIEDCYNKPMCSTCQSTNHLAKEHPEQVVLKKTLAKLKAQSSQAFSLRKALKIPKPFISSSTTGSMTTTLMSMSTTLDDICGSIAHKTAGRVKKTSSNNKKPRIAN